MERQLQFAEIAKLAQSGRDYACLPDSYIYVRVDSSEAHMPLTVPFSLVGFTICLVEDGQLSGTINDKPFHLAPHTLFTFPTGALIKFDLMETPTLRYELLFLTPKFLHDLNLDINVINIHAFVEQPPEPTLLLTDEEGQTLRQMLRMMGRNARNNHELQFAKHIGRSLAQAIIYQLLHFHLEHHHQPKGDNMGNNRQNNYLQDFMRLVQIHHTQHRSVNFYASKLFISPKYLSHLVKEATGRSASDWISRFVITEAKNMLRFSNKNIQQVAFALNFPSQSSFGKYFKHQTGQSPSEYQKS